MSLGLACCAVEVDAAIEDGLLIEEEPDAPAARRAVLLVAGTVTTPLAPLVDRAVAEAGPAVSVMAFGACASTGGPYWDSPTVVNGVADVLADVTVHTYVPGCPPRPDALCTALAEMESA